MKNFSNKFFCNIFLVLTIFVSNNLLASSTFIPSTNTNHKKNLFEILKNFLTYYRKTGYVLGITGIAFGSGYLLFKKIFSQKFTEKKEEKIKKLKDPLSNSEEKNSSAGITHAEITEEEKDFFVKIDGLKNRFRENSSEKFEQEEKCIETFFKKLIESESNEPNPVISDEKIKLRIQNYTFSWHIDNIEFSKHFNLWSTTKKESTSQNTDFFQPCSEQKAPSSPDVSKNLSHVFKSMSLSNDNK